jgi:hypothetical protein
MSGGRGKILTHEQLLERRKQVAREDENEPIICIPDEGELAQALQGGALHGFCENWCPEQAQEEIVKQRFGERMMLEEKWRREWFEHWTHYGFCRHHPGRLIPFNAPAIVPRSDLDSSLYGCKAGMEKVQCPDFRDKRRHGSRMFIGKYAKKGLEH